jgi:sensor histidine kinase YesM
MRIFQKSDYRRFAIPTLVGLMFGGALGFVATRYNWGFGYTLAVPMVLVCSYGVEIIDILTSAHFYPRWEKYPRGKKLMLQMVSSLLLRLFGWFFFIWIASLILGFSILRGEVLVWLPIAIVVGMIIRFVRQLLIFNRELRQKDILEERLKSLATQAELKALKAQINPHFLFNSLNTVASLTKTDPDKAEEATLKLADVFRYTLSSSNREFVTLQDELDFLDSYLDVEKARFGYRLQVIKSIQPETLNTRIPSLILQPLVENCLKHGRTPEGYARIEIRCFLDGDDIKIEVRDQGKGVPEEIKKVFILKAQGLKMLTNAF